MNRRGHLIFAIILLVLIYLVVDNFIKINIMDYVYYLPGYFIGAIFPDKLEAPININHRKLFHSRRFFHLILFILIPLTVSLRNNAIYWLYITSFLVGYATHLYGDSLTGRLPH